MNLSKSEYKTLISNVEREFGLLLAKSEESEKKDEGDSHEVKDAITGEVEKEPETKVAQDKESEAHDKKDEKEAEEAHENEGAHGYDEGDMEELHKVYGGMSKPELHLHKCILENYSGNGGELSHPAAPMGKSETAHVEVKADDTLLKNEIAALKIENATLNKNMQDLVQAMNGFVTKAPARKAITEIGVLGKSETSFSKQLNKSEITSILDVKTRDPSLSKADRDVINNYCTGKSSIESIKHLLG